MLTQAGLLSCMELRAGEVQDYFVLALLPTFIAMTIWIRYQPAFNGRRFFLTANWALVAWLFAVVMELFSETADCKILWSTLAFPGVGLLPVAWFLFVYRYTRNETGPVQRWQLGLLIVVPAIATLAAMTNPIHGLFYGAGTAAIDTAPGAPVAYDHGPLFFADAAMLYAFIVASFVLLARGAVRTSGVERLMYAVLLVMTAIPTMANVGYVVFGIGIAGFDPTPFLFSFVLVAYVGLISFGNFFQISLIAKEMIFDSLPNAVLVLSRDGRIIASNRAAQATFPMDWTAAPGVHDLPALADIMTVAVSGERLDNPPEIKVGDAEFEVRMTTIYGSHGARRRSVIGFAFVFFEITTRKQVEQALSRALDATDARLDDVLSQNRRITDEVRTDPLTGLLNRRTLTEEFEAMTTSREDGQVFAVIVDIDHFKKVNDRLGHGVGDKVLVALGTCLRRGFRSDDRVFRLGGEEFLILLGRIDIQSLHSRIAGLREVVAAAGNILLPEDMALRFSAGIGAWPSDADTLPKLLEIADKRLYSAKKSGRNRTVGPLAETG